MKVRELIQREVAALQKDREFNKQTSYPLRDLTAYFDSYPSVLRRWWRVEAKLSNGKDAITSIPRKINYRIQRARRGYSYWDASELNIFLARMLDKAIEEFYNQSKEHHYPPNVWPDDLTEEELAVAIDEWGRTISRMRQGFRNYVLFRENQYDLSQEDWVEAHDKVMAGVKESFDLLATYFHDLDW